MQQAQEENADGTLESGCAREELESYDGKGWAYTGLALRGGPQQVSMRRCDKESGVLPKKKVTFANL